MLSADNLLQMLSGPNERTLRILDRNEQQGDDRTALWAARECRDNVIAFAKLSVAAQFDPTVDAELPLSLPIPSPEDTREILRTLVEAGGSLTEAEEAQAEAHKEQAG